MNLQNGSSNSHSNQMLVLVRIFLTCVKTRFLQASLCICVCMQQDGDSAHKNMGTDAQTNILNARLLYPGLGCRMTSCLALMSVCIANIEMEVVQTAMCRRLQNEIHTFRLYTLMLLSKASLKKKKMHMIFTLIHAHIGPTRTQDQSTNSLKYYMIILIDKHFTASFHHKAAMF